MPRRCHQVTCVSFDIYKLVLPCSYLLHPKTLKSYYHRLYKYGLVTQLVSHLATPGCALPM